MKWIRIRLPEVGLSLTLIGLLTAFTASASGGDWLRFRGAAGSGVAVDEPEVPSAWSPDANLEWKIRLPGPGASSPIVVGNNVLVTCYSGYGVTKEPESELKDLVRHLVCVALSDGAIRWTADVKASLPEDSYYDTGVSSHGYASHTPCSDGARVYCFFGKGGVVAFDLDGRELWRADAGKESDPPRWGSASSPVLSGKNLIVTAAAESQSIIAYDKMTGEVRWRQEATGLDGMWGTPALVRVNDARTDLVMLVAKEVWGLDPDNGRLRWYTDATSSAQAYTSVVSDGPRVFAFAGQGGGGIAIDTSGSGDGPVTLWKSKVAATYASPVVFQSKVYLASRGILSVIDAESGSRLRQIRLRGARVTGNARFGSLDYASPVVAGNRLFCLMASGQMFVFGLTNGEPLLAVNTVTTEREFFWGSPAISRGRMVLRSSRHLYCIADKGESVVPDEAPDSAAEATEVAESNRILNGRNASVYQRRKAADQTGRPALKTERPARPQRPASIDE